MVCLDAKTGETVWENTYNVWLSPTFPPNGSDGPASSAIRRPGTSTCSARATSSNASNGETGETLWKVPLHEQFGMLSTYGGRTNFPIVHEDLVIISGIIINWGDYAKPNHRLLAMDKTDRRIRMVQRHQGPAL